MTAIDLHLATTRKQARRLLRDAQRPIEVRLSTIGSGVFALFALSVIGGYSFRAWLMVQ
jgi:nitrate reductase NapE component